MESARTDNAPTIVEAEGATFTGIVRNLRRGELPGISSNDSDQIISFRLEVLVANGDITIYVPVEIRGREIIGDVAENDRISVNGRRNKEGILTPSSFTNFSTGSRVYVNQPSPLSRVIEIIFLVLFLLLFLLAFLWVAYGFYRIFTPIW